MTIIFNTKWMTERRKKLRRSAPPAEVLLWRHLKHRQVDGYKFRRQVSIGGYVVDFYCPALHLAIEVDGPTHCQDDIVEYDKKRQNDIELLGVRFFRITNEDVYRNIKGVIQALYNIIDTISWRKGHSVTTTYPDRGHSLQKRCYFTRSVIY